MTDLGQWLLAAGDKRRIDGEWDCACFPANWAVDCGYGDPMAKWRGTWETESGALDIIDAAGGLVALFDDGLSSVGISRRNGPATSGDIGVINIGQHEAGAIFTGKRWAIVTERGIAFCSLDTENIAAVWAVQNG